MNNENARIVSLRDAIEKNFSESNWIDIGLLTGFHELIESHPRLLRSLYWNDPDYSGNVIQILRDIDFRNPQALDEIEKYIAEKFNSSEIYISAKPKERRLTFSPQVFSLPEDISYTNLVAVMMPFRKEFDAVYAAIKSACINVKMPCLRADDIWEDATIIQDIFNLILRAEVVLVDFTGKNPNVMYELGIAHTLGKNVIPIAQNQTDVPFDVSHHRYLPYLPNAEGLSTLAEKLEKKLKDLKVFPEEVII